MGLFDAFKKKKVVAKELETPPAPEQNPSFGSEQARVPPQDMGMQPSFGQMQEQMQAPMQDFPLPRQSSQFPSSNPTFGLEPEHAMPQNPQMMPQMQQVPQMQMPQMQQQSYGMPQYDDIPMPDADEMVPQQQEMQQQQMQQQFQEQIPVQPKMGSPIPSFRFYQQAAPEDHPHEQMHEEMHQDQAEIPFDISQELLSMPEMMKQHQDLQEKSAPTFSSFEKVERKAASLEHHLHFGKKFITVTVLYDVGEQLVNMAEDLGLAKDTAFRLADLNEQEIEMMAKWQTLQQNMELRIAEMDKVMFKA